MFRLPSLNVLNELRKARQKLPLGTCWTVGIRINTCVILTWRTSDYNINRLERKVNEKL
jgi:hypothetical protein